ncbi:MAG: metal ABC transporter substrate-binding protein [Actinomycetota bacterium]|nr:metal ABC transporter substrate-binding protein [Actinomycetota bacterium]
MSSHRTRVVLGSLFFVLVSACGRSDEDSASGTAGVEVMASFYPLEWASQRVAGERAGVTSLTPPGAEAHDLELSPQDVAEMTEADLVVYLSGFQPAVDDAVSIAGDTIVVDAGELTTLDLTATDEHSDEHGEEEGDEHADEHSDEHGEEEGDEHSGEHGDEASAADPHFWLDPLRLAEVGDALAERMADVDPDGADAYQENAADLRADLEALDEEMRAGLSDCESTTLVTSHEAFGYLADRYGFDQLGISGLSPEDEASPAELAEVTDFVRDNDVDTIYFETLVSPDVAQTVAEETGASTATLDPLEGLTEESAGADYLQVMRSNLTALQEGQSCT